MIVDIKQPDCNCHQCTWLRANQFEKAALTMAVPSPDKCQCGSPLNHVHGCPAYVSDHPKDAVEDKSREISELICYWFSNGLVGTPNPESLTVLLRDLVQLAREKKCFCGHSEDHHILK